MKVKRRNGGFTLVELLVVMGIIAILIALAMPAYSGFIKRANSAGCTARMRNLGVAFTVYAQDNDGQFPGRVTTTGNDKWPKLLMPYVGGGEQSYVDPGDVVATKVPLTDLISNSANNSSFFFNGFSDLGAYTNESITVRLSNLTNLSNLILLGQKVNGSTQYYMDFAEGNQNDILNKTAYFQGANYVFADGSARFMKKTEYDTTTTGPYSDGDTMWLVNKSYVIPSAGP